MGRGSCGKISSQIYLLLIGLILWAAAATAMYIGVYVFQTYGHFKEVATSTYTLVPAAAMVALGVIIFLAGMLGCVGALRKTRCILGTFFVFLFLIFTGELVAGVLGYVYKADIEGTLKKGLTDALGKYGNDSTLSKEIDYMQSELSCCGGVNNYTDWFATPWGTEHEDELPGSCCKDRLWRSACNDTIPVNSTLYDTDGCYNTMTNLFEDNLVYIGVSAFVFALIQFVGMIATCVLFCRRDGEVPYAELGGPGFTV